MADLPTAPDQSLVDAYVNERNAVVQAGADAREWAEAWLDDHDQAHAVATLQDAIKHLKWFAGRLGPGELARGVVASWQELRLMAERIEGDREAARG